MLLDSEQQVRLQFLDEAQEYLESIESNLIGVADRTLDRTGWDGVLRAAHSLKGGGAMMGFDMLSHLAHRLEDSLKVLKTRPKEILTGEIESLLLSGVDHLRDLTHHYRQGLVPTQDWLAEIVHPTFDTLRTHLGDPQPEDAASLLSEEAGEDMAILLFETEVDAILTRLDEVLATTQQTCLKEEFQIAAQELAGLGEMLDLPTFRDLCNDISDRILQTEVSDSPIDSSTEQLTTIAALAQQAWRQAQAMVLVGQRSLIPAALPLESPTPRTSVTDATNLINTHTTPEFSFDAFSTAEWTLPGEDSLDELITVHPPEDLTTPDTALQPDHLEPSELPIDRQLKTKEILPGLEDLDLDLELTLASATSFTNLESQAANSLTATEKVAVSAKIKTKISTPSTPETQDTIDERTIRVSATQLNHMSELFGELMVERNGLTLQLKRLQGLTHLLTQRVQTLEQSNQRLREGYDKITTQTILQTGSLSKSEAATSAHIPSPISATPVSFGSDLIQDFDLLEMDRYSALHSLSQELMETAVQIEEVTTDITLNLSDTEQTTRALTRTTKQLQVGMSQMRMRPINDILGRFPRMLRDLSRQHGKSVEFRVNGGSTLIDRLILDTLSDSLVHLVRNAFDHGIEKPEIRLAQSKTAQAFIEVSAAYRGNQTLITVRDNGGGIDITKIREKAERIGIDQTTLATASPSDLVNLIFEPGFSTASEVTDLSGRGVGMDIVRTNLQQVRGSITVDTELGQGTTFTIAIPFTLSVIRALIVESANLLMTFPTDLVEEVLLLQSQTIVMNEGKHYLDLDGTLIPFIHLQDGLTFAHPVSQTDIESAPKISEPTVLLIHQKDQAAAVRIERYWGEQEVTVRQVEGNIALPSPFAGCTVLGDGRIAPLVDPFSILQQVETQFQQEVLTEETNQRTTTTHSPLSEPPEFTPAFTNPLVMVVDDSVNVRRFLALTLEKAGFRVEQARDGQQALEKVQMGLPIQAIVCDIEMPRLDGYGFLANVKTIPVAKDIPVVMLTSRSGDKHRKLALSLGASDYFSKPFREKDLLTALNHLILSTV